MIRPLNEGTKYDKNAVRDLVNAGWDETTATNLINDVFKNKIHAFVHSPSWLEKYLIGIARMYRENTDGSQEQINAFEEESSPIFDEYLMWVRANREKFGNALDDKFNKEMSYEDVKKELEEIQAELDRQNAEKLAQMEFESSNYTLVPINSYEEMHEKFGGKKTGDGKSDAYAGGGGTAWCHTNAESTYNSWVQNGKYKFFVLMNNNYEDIPFDAKTNAKEHGKDDYGNSLMAIRTDRFGRLKNVTCRANHVGDPSSADNMYNTYAELSEIAGFNVEEEVKKYCEEYVEGMVEFEHDDDTIFGLSEDSDIDNITLLEIPSSINNFYITRISSGAFRGLPHLKKVVVSEGIVAIGSGAFRECEELEEVVLPDSLIKFGDSVFYGCTALTKINLPSDYLERISNYMFQNCSSLKNLELPNEIEWVGRSAFEGCSALEELIIPDSAQEVSANAFKGCTSLRKLKLPENDSETWKVINNDTFSGCTSLEEITIPVNINIINPQAFWNCTNLKKVNCPSVVAIGEDAFLGCTNLTAVNWIGVGRIHSRAFENSGLEEIKALNVDCEIDEGAFKNCKKLKSVTLPINLKTIEKNTFEGCSALADVKFPSELKRIRAQAFKDCKNLSVTLPKGVEVDKTAFEGTKMTDDNKEYIIIGNKCLGLQKKGKGTLSTITIPDGVTEIGERAFAKNTSVKTVIIPEGVTKIGNEAFEDCVNLETVYLPSTLTDLGVSAFSDCNSLGYVKSGESLASAIAKIPEGITKIPDGCFLACDNLQYIGLPDSLTSIGTYAFSESGLISLTIPDHVEKIEYGAFADCENLETVSMPSTLKYDKDVFDGTNANITKRQVEANESYSKYKLSLNESDLPELYKLDIQLHYDIINGEAEHIVDEGSILDALGELIEEKIRANKEYICRGNQFNDFEIEYTNCDDEYGVVSFEVEVDFKIMGKYFTDKVKYLLRNYNTTVQYKGRTVEVEVEQVFPVLRYISE